MRQNPMFQPRGPVGGRSMPAWFSATLVNQSRVAGPSPPPPPLPSEPPPEESDYEEIDHLPKSTMKKAGSRRTCSLCGNPNPAVSCEMCDDQIFCGSCNDMYHRHPKRQHHSRKILEPLDNRPPLPPKTPVPHEMGSPPHAQLPPLPPQSNIVPQPVPPPRRKGRFGMRSNTSSPTSGRKSFFDPVGTLKRFVGGMAQRPLPSPPKAPPPLPPKSDFVRSMTPTFRGQTLGDRRLNSPQPGAYPQDEQRGRVPMSAFEMQNARTHSISVANLSGHTSSHDSGYPDWEEDDEEFFSRNRAHSVSGGVLGRYPSTSQDASHFATMGRQGRNQMQRPGTSQQQVNLDAPERPPPPLPPRQFPSQTQLSFQSSQSVFDLDRMAAAQQSQQAFGMPPWNYPMPGYPFDFQQAMMMGYPGGGTMHRTPSTQSMGPTMNASSAPNQFGFGWGPMPFGQPMTQMEMDMMSAQRRGSEQFMNALPNQQQLPTQRGVPLSNPVTPQGSFRKKAGRHMSVEPELTRRLERVDLSQNRRSGTPSSFVRVPPSAVAPAPAIINTPKSKPPVKKAPSSDQSPDDSYFSSERQQNTESASSESTPELTENPEGPWECEHCTFINPKSTKVCTICCKTPSDGYKVMTKSKLNKAKARRGDAVGLRRSYSNPNRDASAALAAAAAEQSEEVPVLKSKLSISREKQQAKINLVSHVEKERVKTPKSSLKAGSSGTLKAGAVPPGPKAVAAVPKQQKKGKLVKPKQVVQLESDDDEEEDGVNGEQEEELVASQEEQEDDDAQEEVEDEEEEEEEEEEEDDEEADEDKSEDDADDEENGVVDVKITARSAAIHSKSVKAAAAAPMVMPPKGKSKQAVVNPKPVVKASSASATTSTKKATKPKGRITKTLVDSNEDVYGSVPIQTLAISPKIDIKRSSKSKTSTGVGPSPPPQHYEISISTKSSSPLPPPSPSALETQEDITQMSDVADDVDAIDVRMITSIDVPAKSSKRRNSAISSDKRKGSDPTTKGSRKEEESSPEATPISSKKDESSGKSNKEETRSRKLSVSTGIQTATPSTSSSNSSNSNAKSTTASSSNGESETGSSSPFQARKEMEGRKSSASIPGKERKISSVGTSPPPQSISTQTYEDAGIDAAISLPTKSLSKTSLDDYEPPRHIEMSEKALRYARKARNKEQHHQKLKRSLSTQLTYTAEPWLEATEGRHLYRSSSRQSLASDTRSLPLSGPPSRENSPPPMRGSGGGSSRWYEDFRRFPPPTWDRFPAPGDYFSSIDDSVSRRKRDSMRSQEFELTRMLKDADEFNYSPEDVQVAIRMCGDKNPIKWMQENWSSMIETVQTLATKYGREKGNESNDVGTISLEEAKESLRANRGNVWVAVTECVDQRRKKFHELESRGTFLREDILSALSAHRGNLEAAYVELSKAQLKPFLMRIWGPPAGTENESAAPTSSAQATGTAAAITNDEAVKPKATEEQVPVITDTTAVVPEATSSEFSAMPKEQKAPELSDQPPQSSTAVVEPPKLEMLVSNAEKVTQEIERALKELKSSGAIAGNSAPLEIVVGDTSESSGKKDEALIVTDQKTTDLSPQEKTGEQQEVQQQQQPLPTSSNVNNEEVTTAPEAKEVTLQRQKSDESEPSATVPHIKSDGEDESFADAVSEAASSANSPPPSRPAFDEQTPTENEVVVNEDDQAFLEEEYDEDVLEIEIDDTEAHISEFIQNYEILPAQATPLAEQELVDNGDEVHDEHDDDENAELEQQTDEEQVDEATGDDEGQTDEAANQGITKGEIEQLLTTLTSTFSEMEQFATKIKENIATEIQQQLAAATNTTQKKVKVTVTSHDHSEDGSYEPIELPPGIEENVNKKAAKYQRLAAKKKKIGRHKSPETHAFQFGMIKETSASPSPSTSLSQLVDESQADPKASGESEEQPEPEPEKDEEEVVEAQEQPENGGIEAEQMEVETDANKTEVDKGNRYSDYEEVEIGQEDEEGDYNNNAEEPISEVDEDAEGEFVEEEDVNESSIVEESDEDAELEVEEEQDEEIIDDNEETKEKEQEESQEQEPNNKDEEDDEEEPYANVDIRTSSNITPSDTDKVIIAGGVVAAKSIRISSNTTNDNNSNGDIVIMAEELSTANENVDEETNEKGNTEVKTDDDANDEKGVTEETPAQRLITEGKAANLKQAELALQLFEMNFNEDDALAAARECVSLCSALSYLQQECDLCTGKFSATEMVSMLRCTHICCRTCARDYFTVQVRDKTIVDATCPFCAEPSTLSDDAELATEYFNHLDILLKNLLDSKHHEMFQRKLRDWTLAKTPNFKWCSKCSSGFITEPMQTRLVCPDCKAVTCAVCMETWDKVNHDHRDNTAGSVKLCDAVPKSIIEYLNANCIECPRCHFRFSLARGGCMHLTCTQCHHEFCSGCAAPFRMGDKCEAKFPICDRLGLHAHHPRNCLFYLRDKEPDVLSKLLEENAIPYFKENSGEDQLEPSTTVETKETESGDNGDENANTTTTPTTTPKKKPRLCQVPVQKETNEGFFDDICGKEAPEGYATVCKTHYIEYLGLLIWQNHLDPITILTNEDLEVIIRRAYKKHPGRPNWLSDEGFRKRLLKVINEDIPL